MKQEQTWERKQQRKTKVNKTEHRKTMLKTQWNQKLLLWQDQLNRQPANKTSKEKDIQITNTKNEIDDIIQIL